MQIAKLFAGLAVAAVLAGCQWNDLERAGAGAAAGAVISGVSDGNVLTGAVIGGAAGALCDDVGAC